MSEKEERIWIEYNIPKPEGAIEATRSITMTRQEAITRLAKAFCQYDRLRRDGRFGCEGCKFAKEGQCEEWTVFNHGGAAEDALNALLS